MNTLFQPKLLVYRNGDLSSVLNLKEIPFDKDAPLSKALQDAQRAHNLPFKAKQLFTTAGVLIRGVDELKDSMEVVVGCGEPFKAISTSTHGSGQTSRPETPLSGRSTPSSQVFVSPSPSPLPTSHPIPNPPPSFSPNFSPSISASSSFSDISSLLHSTPSIHSQHGPVTLSPNLASSSQSTIDEQSIKIVEPGNNDSSSSIPSTIPVPTPTAISPSPSASPVLTTEISESLPVSTSSEPSSPLLYTLDDNAHTHQRPPTTTPPITPREATSTSSSVAATHTPRETASTPSSVASTPRTVESTSSTPIPTPREDICTSAPITQEVSTHTSSHISQTSYDKPTSQGVSSSYTPREITSTPIASTPSSAASTPRATTASNALSPREHATTSATSTPREVTSVPSSASSTPRQEVYATNPEIPSIPLSSSTTPRQSTTSTPSPRASSTTPRSSSHRGSWILGEGEGRGGATKNRIGSRAAQTHVYAVHTNTHTLFHSSASSSPIYWIWGEGEGKGGGTKHRIGTVRLDEGSYEEGEVEKEIEEVSAQGGWTLGEGEGRGGATKEKIGARKRSATTSSPWVLGEGEGRGKGTKDRIGNRSPTLSVSSSLSPSISARIAPHWYRQSGEWTPGEGEGRGGATKEKIGGGRKGYLRPWIFGEGEGRGGATKDKIGRTRSNSASAVSFTAPSRATLDLGGWVLGEGEGRGGATKERIGSQKSPLVSRKSWVLGEGEGRGGGTKQRIGARVPLSLPSLHLEHYEEGQGWILGEGEGRGKATKERIGSRPSTRLQRSTSNPSTLHIESFNGWVWGLGEGRGKGTKDRIGGERDHSPKISPRKRSNSTSSPSNNNASTPSHSPSWVWGEGEGHGGGTKERIGDRLAFHHTWVWGQGEGKGGATKEKIGERTEASGRYLYRQFYTDGRDEEGEDEYPSDSSPYSSGPSSPLITSTHGYLTVPPLSPLASPSSPILQAQNSSRSISASPLEPQSDNTFVRSTPSPHSSKSSRAPASPSSSRKSRSASQSVASSVASSPAPSPLPSSRSQSPPAYTARSVSSVSSTSSTSTWGAPTPTRSVSSRASTKPRSYSTGTPVAKPSSSASTRATPLSPSQQRTRGGAPRPPQPEVGKEDWLWRALEGLAVSGVQGVSEDNDRFLEEVREEAREIVARTRVSVGPSADSVSFQCSLAVVGPPKSGKTSLLYSLSKALCYELAGAEQWKRTFIFPVCWSSLLATSYDLLSLYNKVVARILYMLPLVQAVPNLSAKLAAFFSSLLAQPHLPRIPNEFSELKPDQVWSLKHLAENVQKTWHNGTPDTFALAIARLPVAISELFDYSQVLFVYDDLDAAQVLLGKGNHPQGSAVTTGKMEKRFLTHLKSVLVGHMYLLSGVATKSLLRSLAEAPVDIASDLEVVSTLDIIPTPVFLEKYPECNADLVIEGSGQQVTLTPQFFGGAPGYLAKVVDLIRANQARASHGEEESAGVKAEREQVMELRVLQLVKALSGAPIWAKTEQTQAFPLDAPLSARFLPRNNENNDNDNDGGDGEVTSS